MGFRVRKEVDHSKVNWPALMEWEEGRIQVTPSFIWETRQVERRAQENVVMGGIRITPGACVRVCRRKRECVASEDGVFSA